MSEIAVVGRVKWFDPSRGFGFLVCDQIEGDILVHHSTLRPHHRRTVPEGSVLEIEAELHERGWMAARVLSIDTSEAVAFREPCRNKQEINDIGEWELVTLKWFDHMRGYGFALRVGGEEAFLHALVLKTGGLQHVAVPGMELQAKIGRGPKGFAVAELQFPEVRH